MSSHRKSDSSLVPYRILDLTEGGCMIGARFLGDLGADVIKIEPPGGSPSRIGPFYKDIPHSEKSLFWFAYNANKRGITLDIERADGQEIFKKLVKSTDVVIESFEPGYMDSLGLGYDELIGVKPDIIMTSITPFGQNGPKAHLKGSDLTAWASGGYLYTCGDPDKAPVWVSFPQAFLHSGVEAASGTMAALWYRCTTGEGQRVDVSIQECVVACCFQTPETWDLNGVEITRLSHFLELSAGNARQRMVWRCKDGYVLLIPTGGVEPFASAMKNLVGWMDENGMADDWLQHMNWVEGYDSSRITKEMVERVEEAVGQFIITKTKSELYEEGALKRHIMVAPIANTKDIWENPQLHFRHFWVSVEHQELGENLTYPGSPIRLSENLIRHPSRAPLIGEHNIQIYRKELGFTREELAMLKQAAVI